MLQFAAHLVNLLVFWKKYGKILLVDDYDWKGAACDKVFTIQVRVYLWCLWTRHTFSVEQSTTYCVPCHILSTKLPQTVCFSTL